MDLYVAYILLRDSHGAYNFTIKYLAILQKFGN
jgi:hypothetical protein